MDHYIAQVCSRQEIRFRKEIANSSTFFKKNGRFRGVEKDAVVDDIRWLVQQYALYI